jgi:parallel beta-helix repeat protein
MILLLRCIAVIFIGGLVWFVAAPPVIEIQRGKELTEFKVSNADGLKAALSKAKGGDKIILSAGAYGAVKLSGYSFSSAVTIVSKSAVSMASFASLDVSASKNLTFDSINIAFKPTLKTVAWDSAVRIASSSNISLINSVLKGGVAINGVPQSTAAGGLDATGNVLGLPAARGISIDKSSGITLQNNEISTFQRGIVLNSVTGITVAKNDVHDLRMTPLAGADVSDATVDGNHFYNFNPWQFGGAGDHGDLIHFWTEPKSQTKASSNIVISNNFLEQGTGQALLGIYLDDNRNSLGFVGVKITNNLILNGNAQGVRLENVRGSISGNTLVQTNSGTYKAAPGILVTDKSSVSVLSNISGPVSVYPNAAATQSNNLLVQRQDASKSNHYSKIFVNGLTAVAKVTDFAVNAKSLKMAEGAGINTTLLTQHLNSTGGTSQPGDALKTGSSFEVLNLAAAPVSSAPNPVFSDVSKFLPSASGSAGDASVGWSKLASTTPTFAVPLSKVPLNFDFGA